MLKVDEDSVPVHPFIRMNEAVEFEFVEIEYGTSTKKFNVIWIVFNAAAQDVDWTMDAVLKPATRSGAASPFPGTNSVLVTRNPMDWMLIPGESCPTSGFCTCNLNTNTMLGVMSRRTGNFSKASFESDELWKEPLNPRYAELLYPFTSVMTNTFWIADVLTDSKPLKAIAEFSGIMAFVLKETVTLFSAEGAALLWFALACKNVAIRRIASSPLPVSMFAVSIVCEFWDTFTCTSRDSWPTAPFSSISWLVRGTRKSLDAATLR